MEDFHPKMMFVLLKAIHNPLGQDKQESDHDHQQNHVPDIRLFKMNPNKNTHFHQNRCLSFCCGILVKIRIRRRSFHRFLPAIAKKQGPFLSKPWITYTAPETRNVWSWFYILLPDSQTSQSGTSNQNPILPVTPPLQKKHHTRKTTHQNRFIPVKSDEIKPQINIFSQKKKCRKLIQNRKFLLTIIISLFSNSPTFGIKKIPSTHPTHPYTPTWRRSARDHLPTAQGHWRPPQPGGQVFNIPQKPEGSYPFSHITHGTLLIGVISLLIAGCGPPCKIDVWVLPFLPYSWGFWWKMGVYLQY